MGVPDGRSRWAFPMGVPDGRSRWAVASKLCDIEGPNSYEKFDRLIAGPFLSFGEVAALKDQTGVYLVCQEEDTPLCIGKTNKFHVRFGTDLKHGSTRTSVRKRVAAKPLIDCGGVVHFLATACKIRVEPRETGREAEALEAVAIFLLDPAFNRQ